MKNPLNKSPEEAKSTQKPQAKSKVDTLVKTKPKKKGVFENPLVIIGIIAGVLLLIGLVIMIFAFSGNKETPKQQIPEPPTAEEIQAAEEAQQQQQQEQQLVEQNPQNPAPAFATSPTPIETLAQSVIENALQETPQYMNGDGLNLAYPDGSVLPVNHPYIEMAKTNAQKQVVSYIEQNDIIDERVSQETGEKAFYIRLPDGSFSPISDANAARLVEDGMRQQAVIMLTNELESAPKQQPVQAQQPEPTPPPVIVDEMSQQERAEYKDLIEKTRAVNRDLVEENNKLKDELQSQKEQMVKVLQKIEDNESTSRKLRASALPLASGWEVVSLFNDRLWLKTPDGKQVSIAEGEKIPDTQMTVIAADDSSNLVYITEAN